jgi:serine-type D-Ala-D-Ala carboxypeptidase (penicillin-binding protein 5/6)
VTVRRGQRLAVSLDAPSELEGPLPKGERLGKVTVSVDGEPVASAGLLSGRAAPAADLGDKLDSAIPGPRALAWIVLTALLAGVLILAYRLFTRRSASR